MRIAIIGSGLCGLATAWFLLSEQSQSQNVSVTLFDAKGIGGGASGVAAGLMHPFAGAPAKLNRYGWEGYKATCELLEIASQAIGRPVAFFSGLQRLAITDKQKTEYQKSAKLHSELIWCEKQISGVLNYPGLFVPSCVTIDCPLYLKGLWMACEKMGAQLITAEVKSMDDLNEYDQIFIAAGAFANQLLKTKLPITQVKGQILEMSWPAQVEPLTYPVNSLAYVIMNENRHTCIVGASYERDFTTMEPDLEKAKNEILPKAYSFLPLLEQSKIINCRAGIRASCPAHLPIIKRINEKCWVITGMGSKGLLYHALFSRKLVSLRNFAP